MLRAVGTTVLLVVVYYLLPLDPRAAAPKWVGLILGVAVLVGVTAWHVRAILRSAYPILRAIEALGAKRDGVIRHYGIRRDGSARDVVMYSILASEWRDVRRYLELRLDRR